MTSPAHDLPPVERLLAERGWLQALARSLVVDASTADDVAQDATVLALTKPPREPAALRGWLRRVVRNLASNARRAAGRREGREAASARPEAARDDPSDVVLRWELRREVVDAVLALDEPYRTTVLLRFFEGLEPDEISARLGVPRDTVKTRQRRALEMLRARLAHFDDRAGRRGLAVLLVLARPEDGGGAAALPAATAAGNGAAEGLVLGGLAMSAVTKTLVAAAVLAVIAAGWWTIRLGERRDVGGSGAAVPAATGPAAAKGGRAKRPEAASDADAASVPASLAAADRERDLHGVVLDPDGRPVAAARVEVLRTKPWSTVLAQEANWSPYDVQTTVATRADGTFVIRLAPGDDVALRVDATGFAMWESIWRQAGERVTVRLARAVTLDVTVLDAGRAPVAGAVVRVLGEEGGGRMGRHVATVAGGRVVFARLPRGASVNVLVQPVAAPDAIRPTTLTDAESQSLEIVLPQGYPVHGTVADAATGNPIAGARVARRDTFLAAVTTGPDGRFTIEGLERGHGVGIYADAPGYARGSCFAAVLAAESASADVRIALLPGARVRGRVVTSDDAAGPGPVRGADVVLLASWRTDSGDGRSLGGGLTGADGRFEVTGLSPGRAHALRIRAAGHGGVVRRVETTRSAPYTIDVGDVVLPAARTLRGVVVDGEDRPVPRAAVLLVGPRYDGDPDATRDHRRTDDLGRFAFGDAAPGEFEVEASQGLLRTKTTVTVAPDADPPPTTLVLATEVKGAAKFPVRVRVVDEEGNPVAGVNVQAGYVANGASDSVQTDATGVATAPGAFPPRYVHVSFFRNEALGLKYERPGLVFLRPGQSEQEVVLRRIGGAAGAEMLSGRVVDADGAAVPYATVGVTVVGTTAGVMHGSGGRAGDWTQADAGGKFSIAIPRGATADLVAKPQPDRRGPKRFGEILGVRPGEPVEIVVREPTDDRTLDVTVTGPDGLALRGALVHVHYDGEDWEHPRMSPTDGRGAVSFPDLPGAPLTVDVILKDPAGRVNVSRTLTGARVGSTQASLRITVPEARTIRGRVLLPDGTICGGAVVHASSATCRAMTIAEADGTFVLEVSADAPLPFSVYANPLRPEQTTEPLAGWDLAESIDRELEIRLGPVPKR